MAKRQSFILEEKTILTFKHSTKQSNLSKESTYALPEKTKRGPPTNKNIFVRNMKAQISNMSLNENAGFKSEYHVRYILLTCLILLICVINTEFVDDEKYLYQ